MAVFRRYRVWIGVACIAALFVGICSRAAFVPDDSMSPSLLPGDLVFILPTRTAVDDVVAVVDPLDPTVWTLRRVEAIGGEIRYTGGSFVTEQAPQLLDMGLDENGFSVIQEADHYRFAMVGAGAVGRPPWHRRPARRASTKPLAGLV